MDKKRVEQNNRQNLPNEDVKEAEGAMEQQTAETVPAAEPAIKEPPRAAVVEESGIISANTKVVGDIATDGHLAIYGEVEGNISARGDIVATGKIEGDIICSNLRMAGCQVKTHITAKEIVVLEGNARLEGRIKCRDITIDGIVKGDIEAAGEVNIYKNARIMGNIKAKTLGIESGAEIQGNLMVVK